MTYLDETSYQSGYEDGRSAARLFQVEVATIAWELGRDHPMFDRLMAAVTRHNSYMNRSTGRTFDVVAASEGRPAWGSDIRQASSGDGGADEVVERVNRDSVDPA